MIGQEVEQDDVQVDDQVGRQVRLDKHESQGDPEGVVKDDERAMGMVKRRRRKIEEDFEKLNRKIRQVEDEE